MAKAPVTAPPIEDLPVDAASVEAPPSTPSGPIPGTTRIHNLQAEPRDFCLADSTNVHLWPFARGGTGHISEPIKKSLLTDAIRKQAKRLEIRLVEEVM